MKEEVIMWHDLNTRNMYEIIRRSENHAVKSRRLVHDVGAHPDVDRVLHANNIAVFTCRGCGRKTLTRQEMADGTHAKKHSRPAGWAANFAVTAHA